MFTLEKLGSIFLLTLTGVDEHRLNPANIGSLRSSLRQVKDQSTRGSVLVTTAQGKFFSNGFDTAWVQSSMASGGGSAYENLMHLSELFQPVVADLVSLPIPTIAAVTGHAVATGFVLASSHDYVLMRGDRARVLYMTEMDMGVPYPDYFFELFKCKVGQSARRDILLKAAKMQAAEALAVGLVDSVHESPEATVEAAMRLAEELVKKNWDLEVYLDTRTALYHELFALLGLPPPKGVPGLAHKGVELGPPGVRGSAKKEKDVVASTARL